MFLTIKWKFINTRQQHMVYNTTEDSNLLGCDPVSADLWFPEFGMTLLPSPSRASRKQPKQGV